MKPIFALLGLAFVGSMTAQIPDNLVAEGIPAIPAALREDVSRYLEFRTAAFEGWHPVRKEMLIATRFGDTTQLHLVKMAGGARKQLTFSAEPISAGAFQPKGGEYFIYSQDTGGGEFFQFYRFDLADARITRITDGKSRNTTSCWGKSGRQIAFSSTRRNGRDTDLWIMDPQKPDSAKMVYEAKGGGWIVSDWAKDESRLLVGQYISINESSLHLLDLASGRLDQLTQSGDTKASYSNARFDKDDRSILFTTDRDRESHRLVRMDVQSKTMTTLAEDPRWDVESFEISPNGETIALVTNEDGISLLRFVRADDGKEILKPTLPPCVIAGMEWHGNNKDLGLTITHAQSPADAYSVDVETGQLTRWTESETGGLDPGEFRTPQLIHTKSFDGLSISGWVYRPDPVRFPGRRPVIVNIHGGPEGQSRPIFQARNNYYMNEMGIAMLYPNVRGSAGYGKTFLTLDNGRKREDSVKDIGAFLNAIVEDASLDSSRIAVMGGSYGGYMTLASMTHFGDRLRCGVDVVGISNFVTFLENTQDYRRDLRRVEYGDERDVSMREFLLQISPMTNVRRINRPLFIVQGKNDPRVPESESVQMMRAVRENGGVCSYLMAKDEGHGFQKKKNADYQFLSTILFLREHLVGDKTL